MDAATKQFLRDGLADALKDQTGQLFKVLSESTDDGGADRAKTGLLKTVQAYETMLKLVEALP